MSWRRGRLASLQLAAQAAGVEFFTHFEEAQESEADLTLESLRYRADVTTAVLDGILHRPAGFPCRRWGINE